MEGEQGYYKQRRQYRERHRVVKKHGYMKTRGQLCVAEVQKEKQIRLERDAEASLRRVHMTFKEV